MKTLDDLTDALRSLKSNKMRSVLTTLGIVIGVAAVIIMVSVSNGTKKQINDMIDKLGANIMMVKPGRSFGRGVMGGSGSKPNLTESDARAIQEEVYTVSLVAPIVRGNAQVIFGNLNWSTSISGITNEYLKAREWDLASGRLFESSELSNASKVAIFGKTVASNIFPYQDPVGQQVRINRTPFTIIGVLESKGQGGRGEDQDDVIMIPLSTARGRVLGGRSLAGDLVNDIYVKARNTEVVSLTEELISNLLRERHRIGANDKDDFEVRNTAEMMSARAESSEYMSLLLMAVASISLLVGGIGIMNIMLVSVTERTREIGLNMAVGATSRDIMSQFLVESIVLSLVGGIICITLGVVGSITMSTFSQWEIVVDPSSALLAFVFSSVVGVFFGFYPAHKASQLDPIEALRHE